MSLADEIGDSLSASFGGAELDEDELLNELDNLEQESLDEMLLTTPRSSTIK